MSRRLYFVLPDIETSRKVERELLLAHMESKRMHFLGKRGVDMKDLPEATAAHKTNLLRGLYIGFFAGIITGLLAGFYLYFNPGLLGMQIPPFIIFICAIVGAILGAWISGPLIGASTPNSSIQSYTPLLHKGHVLLILDVPPKRTEEIRKLINSIYPQEDARQAVSTGNIVGAT